MSLPGPGSYIKDHSTFGRSTISKPESFQFFGSGVERFKNPHAGSSVNAFKQVVGPGLYDSLQKPHNFRQQVFQYAGSASFVNSARKGDELFVKPDQYWLPGPCEYNP